MERIDYHPVDTIPVEIAAVATVVNGAATSVRIWLRSLAVISSPTTYITDNDLAQEVVSQAGLNEETEFSAYTLVSSHVLGSQYIYTVDATVA